MRFELVTITQPIRPAVEALAFDVFSSEYGAAIPRLPELMIAVLDDSQRPQCVAGLRDGSSGFFSEQYLNLPVEQAIATACGMPVARPDILELCTLASARPGGLLMLMRGFADLGLRCGYRWGLFTATLRLRCLAERLGLRLIDLGPARPDRITDVGHWGSYYEQDPRVCAIDGRPAQARLGSVRMPCAPLPVAEMAR